MVRRILNGFIDGMTAAAICRMLNDDGVPPARSAPQWEVPSVWRLVRSRYLRGELQYKGKTVLDSDGNPVMLTDEPLITESEWNLLTQALQRLSKPHKGQRETNHLLLRIAYCGECDRQLYYQRAHPQDQDHYYRCTGRHGMRMIRESVLEAAVEDFLLREYGQDQIERRVAVGKDYASELATSERSLADLEEQYLANNLTAERFANVATKLEGRITELRALAQKATEEQWEKTGETVADRWQRSDTAGRRDMLQRLGIRWYLYRVYRIKGHAWGFHLETEWLPVAESHERLARETAAPSAPLSL